MHRDTLIDRTILMLVMRWLTRRRRRRTAPQLAVLSGDTVGDAVVLHGIYERYELGALATWLRTHHPKALTGAALDVGGNIGNHAVFFANMFSRVISFEPNTDIFPILQYNLASLPSAEARNVALSNKVGSARLDVPDRNFGGARVVSGGEGKQIRLERLDDQDFEDELISLIKLDVEGHELCALQGGIALIAQFRPIIVFEQHATEVTDGSTVVIDWLRDQGYDAFYVVARPKGVFGRLRGQQVFRMDKLSACSHPMIIAVHRDAS